MTEVNAYREAPYFDRPFFQILDPLPVKYLVQSVTYTGIQGVLDNSAPLASILSWAHQEVQIRGAQGFRKMLVGVKLDGVDAVQFLREHIPELRHGEPPAATQKKVGCPQCGHAGDFIRMALCCPQHGVFGGC